MVSVNVENRIGHTTILCLRHIKVVRNKFAVLFHEHDILEQCILMYCAINIRFSFFAEIDCLCVTATLKIEDSIFIPAMLIITNQCSMWVGRQSSLTSARKAKEEGRVTVLTNIGRAMHWELWWVLHWKPVVHETENSFFVLATIVRAKNDGFFLFNVENNCNIRVEIVPFPFFIDLRTGVDDCEVRFEALELIMALRAYKHVGNKMLRPCHLVDKSNLLLTLWVGTTVAIEDIAFVKSIEVRNSFIIKLLIHLGSCRLINVTPPHVLVALTSNILDNPLIFWRATSKFASVDSEGVTVLSIGDFSLAILIFVIKKLLECQIPVDSRWVGNSKIINSNLGACISACNCRRNIVLITG
mmetsp:Transcript_2275/g.3194  ORF Transcript_2275/g.3194 Transcript_2275/m.3194 type:complete len:357 (+) Transcript_2275:743-1813(+)